jgi:hypothetical protein
MDQVTSAQSFTTAWLGGLLAFPFRDPAWKRKLLVSLLLVIAGFFTFMITLVPFAGYNYRILRRVTVGDGVLGLPEWEDWGGLVRDGLKLTAAGVVYALPMVLLVSLTYFLFMLPMLAMSFQASPEPQSAWLPLGLSMGSMLLIGLMMALVLVVSIVYMVALPAALAHLAAEGRFWAAFEVQAWFPVLRANLSGFALAAFLPLLFSYMGMLVSQLLMLTVVLCVLYPFVLAGVSLFTALYSYSLYGLAYRVGADRLGRLPPAAAAAAAQPGGDSPAEG